LPLEKEEAVIGERTEKAPVCEAAIDGAESFKRVG